MGMELKTECEGDDDPASCSDLVKTLGETAPTSPLLEGVEKLVYKEQDFV
jgi:hypothetical protein